MPCATTQTFNRNRRVRGVATAAVLLASLACMGVPCAASLPANQVEFFEKQIRPVLVERCYECHNSTGKKKGGLALDWKDALLAGGDSGPAVVPGKPEESTLVRAIRHDDSKLKMPKDGPKLSEDVVTAFSDWIRMGLPDPRDHAPSAQELAKSTSWESIRNRRMAWWSFQPVTRPPVPSVRDEAWSSQPVDRFILSNLEAAGLHPAADADRRTLLRRVTFALTGLPPTPDEIIAFLRDTAPDAYEHVVDRLLASPHFGERWARHWMDLVRYTDSHGGEGDPPIPFAWRYRDYLIAAFNDDVPYNRLVREHIAGDLLPDPRVDPTSGINQSALGIGHYRMVQHGYAPTEVMEEQITFTDNQIDVISKAFMGLTVSCARCHDHKFDPISQTDFYALYGIMASSRPALITVSGGEQKHAIRREMEQLKDRIRGAMAEAWLKAADELPAKLTEAPRPEKPAPPAEKPKGGKKPAPPPAVSGWQATINEAAAAGRRSPLFAWVSLRDKTGDAFQDGFKHLVEPIVQSPASVNPLQWNLAGGDYAKWYWHGTGLGASPQAAGAFRVRSDGEKILADVLPAGVCSNLVSTRDSAILNSPRFKIETDEIFVHLCGGGGARCRIVVENYPRADGPIYPSVTVSGDEPRWYAINTKFWKGEWGYLEIAAAGDLPIGATEGRSWFGVTDVIGRSGDERAPSDPDYRVPGFSADDVPVDATDLARRYGKSLRESIEAWRDGKPTDDQARLLGYMLRRDLLPNTVAAVPNASELVSTYRRLEESLGTPVRAPGVLEATGFDQPLFIRGDHKQPSAAVPRRFIEALDPTPYNTTGSGRLELADSLFSPKNPLTARVAANRVWSNLFGVGIVATADNFGRLGDEPTNPRLLDYLATQLIDNGWSIKRMIRLLVTSRTYRQASGAASIAIEKDPTNRLLSHFPVMRLDAESVRDTLLAVTGSLDSRMYGPPTDGNANRRAIYVGVFRTRLDPFLSVFDAPQPFTTQGRREVTNVPAQSLTLLNDPFVLDHARRWADAVCRDPALPDVEGRISRMFLEAFGREATASDRDDVAAYLKSAAAVYGLDDRAMLGDTRPWRDLRRR